MNLEEIIGRTRFQKIVFLLRQKFGVAFSYNFTPYYYGPYSSDLQHEISLLSLMGFLDISPSNGVPYTHRLTEKGIMAAKSIEEQYRKDPEVLNLISSIGYFKGKSTFVLINEAKKLMKYPEILTK
jgi:uncharacterized protein YwgA